MPSTLSSLDTVTSRSACRPPGLQREDPLAGAVGNARWDLCRLGGNHREEAKKASVELNPPCAVAARQPPPLHGRQDAAQKNVCLKTHPQTHLPARAGASSLSHPPPVQAGLKSPTHNPIQPEEPDCVRVAADTSEMPKAHKAGWQGYGKESVEDRRANEEADTISGEAATKRAKVEANPTSYNAATHSAENAILSLVGFCGPAKTTFDIEKPSVPPSWV